MKKTVILFLIIILFFNSVLGVEITPIDNTSNTTNTQAQDVVSVKADIKNLNSKVDTLPTVEDVDSSFIQLDTRLSNLINSLPLTILAFIVGVIFLNNLLMFAFFIILKSKGLI